jgi:hypothetical protein
MTRTTVVLNTSYSNKAAGYAEMYHGRHAYILRTLHFQTMNSDRNLFSSDATGEPNPLIHSFVSFITWFLLHSTVFLSFFHPLFFAFFPRPFLDAFVFSRKAPTCIVMSVCINSGPIGRIFLKFDTWKSVHETQVWLTSDKNIRYQKCVYIESNMKLL